MAEEFLVARDVSYRYAARRGVEAVSVLQRFSVSLTEGEFFCLLGPSGCGKTTVLNLMAGFLEPVGGMLTLAGRPIRGPGIDRTVVFQGDDALFNWLRTIDNVAFGLRMQGLSSWSIVMRHAARNALLPVVTAFALGLGASIGGNVVIETVFAWPGIGRVLVQAVQGADYPVAQGAFIMIAFVLVVMNSIADLAYALLDPRVSVGTRR